MRAFLFAIAMAGPALAEDAPCWTQVGALRAERCVKYHSGFDAPMGLTLDSYANAMTGSWIGPVLIAGDAVGSPLMQRIKGQAKPQMPLDGPPFLSAEETAMFEAWVLAGLPEGTGGAPVAAAPRERPKPGEPVSFADVEPVFLKTCIKCHSDNSKLGPPPEGLRLDSLEAILRGGERVVIIPGNPAMSELWRRIVGLAEERMPFDGPPWVPDEDIAMIADWIAQGAPDDEGNKAPIPVGAELRIRGRMTGENEIDGAAFIVTGRTRIDDRPRIGGQAEMRGVVQADGSVLATRLLDR